MTTNFKVGFNSVYTNGPYCSTFQKLYKGVIVVVDMNGVDESPYVYLAIRTKKPRTCIWKSSWEKMEKLIFDDSNCTVECVWDKAPENKSLSSLTFDKEVYDELKENIPDFMKENGVLFEVEATDTKTILNF